MSLHRIVIANETRFMRTALRRLLDKTEAIEVVAEVDNLDRMPAVLERTQPDWLLVSLPDGDEGLPPEILSALEQNPDLRVLAVSRDGSRTRVEWLEQNDQYTGELSVAEFLKIFNIIKAREENHGKDGNQEGPREGS